MFLVGFLFGFIFMVLFLFGIWTGVDTPTYKGYLILMFSLTTGVMTGFLVAAVAWFGLVISGSMLGLTGAVLLHSLFLFKIPSTPPNLLLYNLIGIGMVLGFMLGYEFQSHILLITCSLTGAYMLVRGLSIFLGGFPSELELT